LLHQFGLAFDDRQVSEERAVRLRASLFQVSQAADIDMVRGANCVWLRPVRPRIAWMQPSGSDPGQLIFGQGRIVRVR
jgi:hypothetical protein